MDPVHILMDPVHGPGPWRGSMEEIHGPGVPVLNFPGACTVISRSFPRLVNIQ